MKRTAFFALALVSLATSAAHAQEGDSAAPTASVGYKKGFFIEDGPFKLKTQLRVQSRLTLEMPDGGDVESNFAVQRARLKLSGTAFSPQWGYVFQVDLGKGFVTLKDFYIEHQLPGSSVRVRAGQWKRPFSRQQITSSGSLELVDRAITDKAFGAGRDIGVAVHNDYEKSPEFQWAVGVFNGTGDAPWFEPAVDAMGEVTGGKFTNVPSDFEPVVVVRVGYNSAGLKGYSEADFEGGPLRFGVAASALMGLDADGDDATPGMGEVDFIVKNNGLSASGAVFVATDGTTDREYGGMGAHVQAGYLLTPMYQPVVRFALVDPDGDDNNVMELTGGFSMYFFQHGLKWQTDVGALISQGTDGNVTDLQGRTQLQLSL